MNSIFYPAGALRRRLLHRNGTFVPPAPSTPLRRQVKTDFRRKWAVAGPFFHQFGRFQGVKRPKFRCRRSRRFGFSRRWPETGRFGRFSGPRGPKWNIHFLHLTQKEQRAGRAGCTQVTLFPYNCWVRKEKTRFGPVSGVPGPKRVLGNGEKRSKATGRNYAAGPFIHESGKLQGVKRPKFRWLRACLSRFSRGWPQKGPFGPFLGPGGSRANPKTPIWPPCENRR